MTAALPAGRRRWRGRHTVLAFVLPGLLYLLLLGLYPLVNLVQMSLSDVTARNIASSAWSLVGLHNFSRVLASPSLAATVPNTLIFVAIVFVLGMAGGLAGAVALESPGWLSQVVLGLMVFIWAMPPVVLGGIWKFILLPQGLANAVAGWFGVNHASDPILWLVWRPFALLSVAVVNGWAIIPFGTLVYRAALMDVPKEILEAAAIDGASPWQQFLRIKFPILRPVTLILAVLTLVYAFRSFDFIYVMTYGGPGVSTSTVPFYSYLESFAQFRFGLGAAVAVLTVLVVAVLSVVYVRATRGAEGG